MKEVAFEKALKELVGFQLAELECNRKSKENGQKIGLEKWTFMGNGEKHIWTIGFINFFDFIDHFKNLMKAFNTIPRNKSANS